MSPRAMPRIAALAWVLGCLTACSVPPERSTLEEFFAAARLRDTAVLEQLATTTFEPLERGIVVEFEVQDVRSVDARKKTVIIDAPVHLPDGSKRQQRLTVTLEQGIRNESPDMVRRWIVTSVEAER